MGVFNIIRIGLQILSTIFLLIGLGFLASCLLSSAWQYMYEPGVGEIHLHGLWFDYVFSPRKHVAGMPYPSIRYEGYGSGGAGYGGNAAAFGGMGEGSSYMGLPYGPGEWMMTYKFGHAVIGNEVHRAQPYQVTVLALAIIAFVLGSAALVVSYCAMVNMACAFAWPVLLVLTVILHGAGLIQFYIECMMPEYRFLFIDRLIEQYVGYAFWWGVAGCIGLALAMVTSIGCVAILFIMKRKGEEPTRPTYIFKRSVPGTNHSTIHTISRANDSHQPIVKRPFPHLQTSI